MGRFRSPWRIRGHRARALTASAVALVAMGASAAPAPASNLDVENMYVAYDNFFAGYAAPAERASRYLLRTGRTGPLLGVFTRYRGAILRARRAVAAQQSTGPAGAHMRAIALHSLALYNRSLFFGQRGIIALGRAAPRLALRLLTIGGSIEVTAGRYRGRAFELFDEVRNEQGPPPPGGTSPSPAPAPQPQPSPPPRRDPAPRPSILGIPLPLP